MFRKEPKYEALERVMIEAHRRQPSSPGRPATESELVPGRCSPWPLLVPDMADVEQPNQATLA